ncbi:MAG: hypothetical protein IT166_16260 [Bryobacterales bacterium]|nr:hypothetical protein [Bryobacterales bacterium]
MRITRRVFAPRAESHPIRPSFAPFAAAEGARVIGVNSNGAVTASMRCACPAFDPQYGAPRFIGLNGDDLYLVTSRGLINIYKLYR